MKEEVTKPIIWQQVGDLHSKRMRNEFLDGIFGPLIVRKADRMEEHRSLYDVDSKEHIVVLTEWGSGSFSDFPILVNGVYNKVRLRRVLCDKLMPKLHVTPGLRHRIRVMHAGGGTSCPFYVSVVDHQMLVIALDGRPIKPILTDNVVISQVGLIPRLNNITFAFPSSPLLSQPNDINVDDQLCTDAHLPDRCSALSPACECTQIVNIPLKSSVEIIMINKDKFTTSDHVFHLHGHSFRAVGFAENVLESDLEKIKELDKRGELMERNLVNAVEKDTITVPKNGAVAMRFKASRPGNASGYFPEMAFSKLRSVVSEPTQSVFLQN
ncbi:unnamed protein product [Nesidiocoris tenuis]|uniref:Plastocyanin-like domain-containing protein n=1 Tax=Nesidiocoris tenuis TaxID=355587 RepID=A0A6H5GKA7_9HEMI|nr:unnamed protein product [Nesidiocoris tenuis]